ncbi:MAG: S-layer homology domain-containing protein [Candidatus Limnocylindria bacterium]
MAEKEGGPMKITVEMRRPLWMTSVRLKRARPLVILLALVLAGPVLAANRFSDVPDSNIHHDNISAIADANITRGCNEGGTLYCPGDPVTREQMGSFLARTAGLGGNPAVANADKLDGIDASGFLAAGDYTVMQLGPWHASGQAAVAISYFPLSTFVESAAAPQRRVQLALDGLASVGAIGYGFESARICFGPSPNVTIFNTSVFQASDPSSSVLVDDPTDRPMASAACYTVSDSTPTIAASGTTLLLDLQYSAASAAELASVTTTWTPVSP